MAIKAEELQEIETLLGAVEADPGLPAALRLKFPASQMDALRRLRRDRGAVPLLRRL